jgi:hypothetical protein
MKNFNTVLLSLLKTQVSNYIFYFWGNLLAIGRIWIWIQNQIRFLKVGYRSGSGQNALDPPTPAIIGPTEKKHVRSGKQKHFCDASRMCFAIDFQIYKV